MRCESCVIPLVFRFTGLAGAVLLVVCMVFGSMARVHAGEKQKREGGHTMTEQTQSNMGKRFPEVSAESLAKTRESIPGSARGKVTLVVVAFLRETQAQLDSWLSPFVQQFGDREGFTFYEVPMISSGYKFMRFIIDNGMRAGLPEKKHKHVVTMYGDVQRYTDELGLDPRSGYAFLLDKEGIIRWEGQGFATAEALKELFARAEKLAE